MTHDVFICHSSKDRTIANAICSTLEQRRIRCWIAPRDVLPGSDYAESIIEAISGSKLTVLVFSDNSNQSPHVHREIERTVGHGIPILPFRVDDVIPSPSLEYFISNAHWLDAITPPMEQHLQHLVGTVRLLLDRAGEVASAPAAAPQQVVPPRPEAAERAARPPTWWRWVALGVVAVLGAVTAGVLVLGGSDNHGAAGPAATPTSTPAATETGTPKATARLGSPISLTGMDAGSKALVTALRVVDPATATESFDTPPAGMRHVAVQFQIQNTGTLTYDDSPDNSTTVFDKSGHQFDATTVYSVTAGPLFDSSTVLHPGQKAMGYVVLDIPTGSRVTRIRFVMDSGYADDIGEWTVR